MTASTSAGAAASAPRNADPSTDIRARVSVMKSAVFLPGRMPGEEWQHLMLISTCYYYYTWQQVSTRTLTQRCSSMQDGAGATRLLSGDWSLWAL